MLKADGLSRLEKIRPTGDDIEIGFVHSSVVMGE